MPEDKKNNNIVIIVAGILIVVLIAVIAVSSYNTNNNNKTSSSSSTSSTSSFASISSSQSLSSVSTVTIGEKVISSDKTFLENLPGVTNLSIVLKALESVSLASTLGAPGPFTVFAPVDTAFSKLPVGTVDNLLLPENKARLTSVLTSHVVLGKFTANDLKDGQELTSLSGAKLTVKVIGAKVTLTTPTNPTTVVTITTPDVMQSNGVAHIIDTVILPAQATT